MGCEQAVEDASEAPFELDVWACESCAGTGRVTRYHDVTHQLGTDSQPFWEDCSTCEGTGFCGPDAAMEKQP